MWIKIGDHSWVNTDLIWGVHSGGDGGSTFGAFASVASVSVTLHSGFATQADADAWIADTFFVKES